MIVIRWPQLLDAHDAAIERECAPIDDTPLHDARRTLSRGLECRSSMLRADYFYRARDALHAAGFPRRSDRAEAAAVRIGGTDQDVERLLFEVDLAVSKLEHSKP